MRKRGHGLVAKCGLCARQTQLSARLLAHMQWEFAAPYPSADLPTLEHLQAVWIRGRQIPIGSLFSCCRVRKPSSDGAACPSSAADVAALAEGGLTDEGGFASGHGRAGCASHRIWTLHALPQAPVLAPQERPLLVPQTEPLARRSHVER